MKREHEKAYQVGTVSVLSLHDLSFNCYLFDTFTTGSCFRYLRVVSIWNKKIAMKMLTTITKEFLASSQPLVCSQVV